ncbi:hypothetical protein FS837_000568 [Tulasnella sp. UAMH 9824]|nr:hypothetical protein FS837_000568 [Tulasnella sp. UAMH 9824]
MSSAQSNLEGSASKKGASKRLRDFGNKFRRSRGSSEPPSIHATAEADSKLLKESGSDVASLDCAEPSSSSSPDADEEPEKREARGMPQGTVKLIAERNPSNPLQMRPVATGKLAPRNGARGVEQNNRNLTPRPKPYSREVADKKKVNKQTEPSPGPLGTGLGSLLKALLPTRLE